MATATEEPQIQGVPDGVTAEPIQSAQPQVEGVPAGVTAEPIAGPSAPPASAAKAAPPGGFWESVGHTFGIGKEEAADRAAHPIRTGLEVLGGPAVTVAEGLYGEGKRVVGEVGQAIQAGKEDNPYGVAQHAIQATPIIGGGITRGAEQLTPQLGVQDPLHSAGTLGTIAGTAVQAAPAVIGGWEGLKAARAARLRGAPTPTPSAPSVPAQTTNLDNIEAVDSLVRAGKDAQPAAPTAPAQTAPTPPVVPKEQMIEGRTGTDAQGNQWKVVNGELHLIRNESNSGGSGK